MSFTVFISHSMAAEDRPIVNDLMARLRARAIEPYLAERDPQPGLPLSSKILERIGLSDLVTVFWTRSGASSEWVNQEVGAARAKGKHVIPLVEKGVIVKGLLEGVERVDFDRNHPESALESLEEFLARKRDAKADVEREAQFWKDVGTVAVVTTLVAVLVVALVVALKK
jgi:hypothetical protein